MPPGVCPPVFGKQRLVADGALWSVVGKQHLIDFLIHLLLPRVLPALPCRATANSQRAEHAGRAAGGDTASARASSWDRADARRTNEQQRCRQRPGRGAQGVAQTRADMQARACGQCKVAQRASGARVVPGQCQARPREVGSAAGWRAQGTSFAASAHHRKVRVRVAGHDRVRYARMRTHQRGTEGRGVFIKSSHQFPPKTKKVGVRRPLLVPLHQRKKRWTLRVLKKRTPRES